MIATQQTEALSPEDSENAASWTGLQREVQRFLNELLKTQKSLLALQQSRQTSLVRADWEEIQQLDEQESHCQQTLQQLLNRRKNLLQEFHVQGVSGDTLQQACRNLGWDREAELGSLLKEVKQQAEQLKQTSWSIWVMSQRANRHYAQLLNLITHGLKPAPCYQQHESSEFEAGGALLDASI